MDSLPPSEIAYEQAHIHDDHATRLIVVSNVFTAMALGTLLARLLARRLKGVVLGLDDYLAIAASASFLTNNAPTLAVKLTSKTDSSHWCRYFGYSS